MVSEVPIPVQFTLLWACDESEYLSDKITGVTVVKMQRQVTRKDQDQVLA